MSHESVWNSRPRTYGKGARAWYVIHQLGNILGSSEGNGIDSSALLERVTNCGPIRLRRRGYPVTTTVEGQLPQTGSFGTQREAVANIYF